MQNNLFSNDLQQQKHCNFNSKRLLVLTQTTALILMLMLARRLFLLY
jgi:hypothetical protein